MSDAHAPAPAHAGGGKKDLWGMLRFGLAALVTGAFAVQIAMQALTATLVDTATSVSDAEDRIDRFFYVIGMMMGRIYTWVVVAVLTALTMYFLMKAIQARFGGGHAAHPPAGGAPPHH